MRRNLELGIAAVHPNIPCMNHLWDPVAASSLDGLMQSLHDILGLSILIITHDPNTLVTVCDRIAMIVDKKVESGTLEEMLKSTNPKIQEYFSSTRFKAALSERH